MSSAQRLVAVTGGARGIGAAIGLAAARDGASVALGDLDAAEAQRTAAALPGPGAGLALDVTDAASFETFLQAAQEHFGRPVDVLVNNAGVMWVGPFAEEPEAAVRRQLEVNVLGTMRGMRLVLPAMRARGHGHVVNIASAASKVHPGGEATYAATKHAVYGYSATVREELRGTGVQISVVMPIIVETELAVGTSHGRGRRLKPEDVADAVVATIHRPRFEVHVPRAMAGLTRVLAVAPQPVRDLLQRVAVPNQAEVGDRAARAAYESRRLGQEPR